MPRNERAIFLFFAQQRGWLPQCLVDVNAMHEMCVFVCVRVCESLSALTPFMLEDHQRPARCEAPAKESRSKQAIFSLSSPQFVIHTQLLRCPPPVAQLQSGTPVCLDAPLMG